MYASKYNFFNTYICTCIVEIDIARRNLSDAANNIGNLQGLVRSLVELLKEPDIQLLVCSAGIIFNLTCNNQRNKLAVFNSGGLQVLHQLGSFSFLRILRSRTKCNTI